MCGWWAACFGWKWAVGDAGCGDDRPDPTRAFGQGQVDQGDRARPEGIAQYGSEGTALWRDIVCVSAGGPAASKDWAVEGGAGWVAGQERGSDSTRTVDADPPIRGAAS